MDEIRLLTFLIDGCDQAIFPDDWSAQLVVADMDDGGMGSLRLSCREYETIPRVFGECASVCQFSDEDGIRVVASLYLDRHLGLFELDIWKTDFSPLRWIPSDTGALQRMS